MPFSRIRNRTVKSVIQYHEFSRNDDEGCANQATSHTMKPVPSLLKVSCHLPLRVGRKEGQPLIRRRNHNQSERDNRAEKHPSERPSLPATVQLCHQSTDSSEDCQKALAVKWPGGSGVYCVAAAATPQDIRSGCSTRLL